MHAKRLLILAAVLIVLIVTIFVFKRQPAPTRLAEEVGFERLVPESLTADAVQRLDLYQGEKVADAIRMQRRDAAWIATSYHNAPVKADKVTKLLSSVGTLKGELRSDQEDYLGDFNLKDDEALHLLLYTTDMDKPAAHLLAGKSSGQSGFMRAADNARVYNVNLNLRTEAGLYGDDNEKGLEAKPWLNLQVHDLPKDQVTSVELQTPARQFHLTQQKPPAPEPTEATSDKSEDKTEEKPKPAVAKPQWVLSEPKVAYSLKQSAVDGLVSTLRTLRGDDVVSLDQLADYGLDTSSYRAVLSLEEEGKKEDKEARKVTIAVGKEVPDQKGKRYVRVGSEGTVYILPKWSFNQMFPTLGTLVSLDIWRFEPQDIGRITWEREGQAWTLERQAAAEAKPASEATASAPTGSKAEPKKRTWRLLQSTNTAVDATKVASLLNLTKALRGDDWFAKPATPTGLEAPVLALALILTDQKQHRLTFGGVYGEDNNRYASLEGTDGTFVVSKSTYTALIETLDGLRPAETSTDSSTSSSATESSSSSTTAAPQQ